MRKDQTPRPAGDRRAKSIQALLAEAAAPRERVVDDHMFAVDRGYPHPATFRLQLFTAPRTRPVAVVTQQVGEGAGLINEGEHYAAAVWQRHCPDEPEPPVWIQRFLHPWGDSYFTAVTFPVEGSYLLGPPARRIRITEAEIAQLVGGPVHADRGAGFRPRPPEPVPQPRYEAAWVVRLPRPAPFRRPVCMPVGTPWRRRLGRQLIPRRRGRTCCWQHQGNWHRVSRTAIVLVRR